MTTTAPVSVALGDDPNDCPACCAARTICGPHIDVMRDELAYAAALLAVMQAEREEALYLMDCLEAAETGP